MRNAPTYSIDPAAFYADPYPDLKRLRDDYPVAFVPELGAVLLTRRDDIYANEKKIEIFSSDQPEGLMTVLMGQNMMRKDGKAHEAERKVIFPTISPKTVKTVWKQQFIDATTDALAEIRPKGKADMAADIAKRISGEALKAITGLTNMTWQEMDRVSQGMINGCANYAGDPDVEANCHDCTASIDRHIDEMMPVLKSEPNYSLLSVQMEAGLPDTSIRANVKLAISGGQNEPRDAIAGAIWALLTHPDELQLIRDGKATWLDAFEEYARWISPVSMSPRRVARDYELHGVKLEENDRVFLMFGSGNRDERIFDRPDAFDITRNNRDSIAFGAGPHFCAGAWASRCLIADVALPMIMDGLPGLALDGETTFGGWAFRGPLKMPVRWDAGA